MSAGALRPASLAAVPSLPDVQADPALVQHLPRPVAIEYRRQLRRLDADLEAHIAASPDRADAPLEPEEQGRAVGLDEAASLLGMERRTLERKPMWQRLGGYKDLDGRVKFRLGNLRRHVARRSSGIA
ncbi:MAG: hypothetical protein HY615_15415 [Candidatus Rokubacteria bacterium]|nr:hypothetical protein [Candidatus Rokubacteria bacterium]